ncbi:MAG: magnesium/cobalt transporter CorA [Candidatus Woesearchaeota archaeon]
MFTILKKAGDKAVSGSLADFKKRVIVWLDVIDPTQKEIEKISDATEISLRQLINHLKEKRPHVIDIGNWSVVVFDAVYRKKKGWYTTPVTCFISDKNNVITIRRTTIDAIDRINDLLARGRMKALESKSDFLYMLMNEIISDYFKAFDELEREVDIIELNVFEQPERSHAIKVFKLKKALIYMHKSLSANREVIAGIEKEYISEIRKKDVRKFRDLYNDTVQLIDREETYRDVLTGVLDIYLSSVSNNINHVMKVLTVITALLMAPTLIAGIYGMNFRNMPELYWNFGYYFSLGLMATTVITFFFYFRRKGWI